MNNRAKWAYLSYDSIIAKIQEGKLDEYDVVYTKDTHENYVISPELEPWAVRSRVYVFNSEDEANVQLNTNIDTYIGQIVSIIKGEVCKGYIVNKNQEGVYYVEQLSADNIDYNTLGNRPIENLVGTLDSPIIVNELLIGSYKIQGQYKIIETDITTYLSTDGDLFLIDIKNDVKYIKRFTTDSINDFVISADEIKKNTYVTDKYLQDNGYTTNDYVNAKITAFEDSIKADIKAYVEDIVENVIEEKVETIIDTKLDEKLNNKFEGLLEEEVRNLF
jgi:hypothetical protein